MNTLSHHLVPCELSILTFVGGEVYLIQPYAINVVRDLWKAEFLFLLFRFPSTITDVTIQLKY
jgi:hypothetical protein